MNIAHTNEVLLQYPCRFTYMQLTKLCYEFEIQVKYQIYKQLRF